MQSGTEQARDGAAVRSGSDKVARTAYETALKVDDFFRTTFGRDGWDGKGSPLQVVVHAPNEDGTPNMNNAYWDPQAKRIYIGDGDGELFAPLGAALDVLVHETTHAIVDAEVNMRYEGQQGSINESFADVLGAVADPRDWKIGETVYTPGRSGDAIRDLSKPKYTNAAQVKGLDIEMHDLSGIPSLAAVRVGEQLGKSELGRIWYTALVDHLDSRSGFSGAARATLDATVQLYGAASKNVGIVLDAWKSVGVDARWTRPGA